MALSSSFSPVVLAILALASAAPAAPTFIKSISLNSVIPPTSGIIPAHIAVGTSGTLPVLYVSTLNDSGAAKTSVPGLAVLDPLGPSPAVSIFDTNDAGGLGIDAARGYGGVATDPAGNVFFCWTGNGSNDSARVRKYSPSGTLLHTWLFAQCGSQRWGGIDISRTFPDRMIGARFLNSSTANVSFNQLTTPNMTQSNPVTVATSTANPRDVAYNETNGAVYVNAGGILRRMSPGTGGNITTPAKYDSANGTYTEIVNEGVNSFAGHGVAVSPNGLLVGFSPNQNTGIGANTLRILDTTSHSVVETIGTLNTKGNGTGANLGRGVDLAFYRSGGSNYVFVTDYDNNATVTSRTFNRIAVYTIPEAVPVTLSVFGAE